MNQPPPTEKQTSKRIVSKSEYMRVQGKRMGLGISAAWLFLAAACCAMCVVGLVLAILGSLVSFNADLWFSVLFRGVVLLLFGGAAYCLRRMALIALARTDELNNVVPLTRANIAALSANDTLVRASAEPVQEQEAVLLRAATETTERHEEQLVRPVE